MKPTLTLRTFFIAAFFISYISIASAQTSYTVTYGVDVVAEEQQAPIIKTDTVTVVDPVTLKEETKIIHSVPHVVSTAKPLFANEKAAAPFRDSLISGLLSGAIKAYNGIDDKDPLSLTDVKHHISAVDTVTVIHPVTLKEETKIITSRMNLDRVLFYEDWNIDKAGNITKKVKGYSLLAKDYDLSGNFLGCMKFATIKTATK